MAYITPKTTWVAGNVPEAPDFNRIEGNTVQHTLDIAAEAATRAAADLQLQGNINVEIYQRGLSDTDLSGRISAEIVARGAGDDYNAGLVVTERNARIAADESIAGDLAGLINGFRTPGTINSFAFLRNLSGSTISTGEIKYANGGDNFRYSGIGLNGVTSDGDWAAQGIWLCLGYCANTYVSLFIKIS